MSPWCALDRRCTLVNRAMSRGFPPSGEHYEAPVVTDHGTLIEITETVLGSARVAAGGSAAFLSSPVGGQSPPPSPVTTPDTGTHGTTPPGDVTGAGAPAATAAIGSPVAASGHGAPTSGDVAAGVAGGAPSPTVDAASGGSGATQGLPGGSLPFTGLAVGPLAAAGAALAAGGAALRRLARRA
jgi:hypothetical protein